MVNLPTWPAHVAHVAWPHDGAILLMPETYGPDDAVDLRCGHCLPDSSVAALDNAEKRIIFMIHHARGCQAVDDLLAMAGLS